MEHEPEDADYEGQATLVIDDAEYVVSVRLRGHHQPIDGLYRWYGRIAADERLSDAVGNGKRDVVIRTPQGEAVGVVGEKDLWDRYGISGKSTPPYHVPTTLDEIEADFDE